MAACTCPRGIKTKFILQNANGSLNVRAEKRAAIQDGNTELQTACGRAPIGCESLGIEYRTVGVSATGTAAPIDGWHREKSYEMHACASAGQRLGFSPGVLCRWPSSRLFGSFDSPQRRDLHLHEGDSVHGCGWVGKKLGFSPCVCCCCATVDGDEGV